MVFLDVGVVVVAVVDDDEKDDDRDVPPPSPSPSSSCRCRSRMAELKFPSSLEPKRLIVKIPKSRVKDEVSKLKIHPDLPSYRLSTNSTHCLENYC